MPEILFDHIAIAIPRIADASAVLVDRLGGAPAYGGTSDSYRFAQWRFAGGGRLEVLEPIGPDGFLHRFFRDRGPGIHHVTFVVPSLTDACARARANGHDIVGYDDSDPEWKEAFLHPKQALGIVVQLAQSSTPPPSSMTPASSQAVTLLGLRMRARSRERAVRQWESVLKGQVAEVASDELTYRWPSSPLRIVVEIDGSAAEGAIGIEYTTERTVSVPDGRDPVLGLAFLRRPPERP